MRTWFRVLMLLAALALPIAAAAQVNTATINGIIHDESKAVLPGAGEAQHVPDGTHRRLKVAYVAHKEEHLPNADKRL